MSESASARVRLFHLPVNRAVQVEQFASEFGRTRLAATFVGPAKDNLSAVDGNLPVDEVCRQFGSFARLNCEKIEVDSAQMLMTMFDRMPLRVLKSMMIFILNVLLALINHWLRRDLKIAFLYITHSVDLYGCTLGYSN